MSITDSALSDGAAQALVEETRRAMAPLEVVESSYVYLVPDGEGGLIVVDASGEIDAQQDGPRRMSGTHVAADAESLVKMVAKFGDTTTEIYADPVALTLVAVFDAGDPEATRWREHRAVFGVQRTVAWQAWEKVDGEWLDQMTMAEHFEDRLIDFTEPDGADVVEIAQSFDAARSGTFKSSTRLSTGATSLEYVENIDATAQNAARQRIQIPDRMKVALKPFEGADTYAVSVRFRYRIREGRLQLSVKMERPEDVLRTAFDDVVKAIAAGTGKDVWSGQEQLSNRITGWHTSASSSS